MGRGRGSGGFEVYSLHHRRTFPRFVNTFFKDLVEVCFKRKGKYLQG